MQSYAKRQRYSLKSHCCDSQFENEFFEYGNWSLLIGNLQEMTPKIFESRGVETKLFEAIRDQFQSNLLWTTLPRQSESNWWFIETSLSSRVLDIICTKKKRQCFVLTTNHAPWLWREPISRTVGQTSNTQNGWFLKSSADFFSFRIIDALITPLDQSYRIYTYE